MKHLKPYKIFESLLKESVDILNDIAEDIRDSGYEVLIEDHQSNRKFEYKKRYIQGNFIKVRVVNNTKYQFSDIKKSFEHMISYMKTEGYEYDVSYTNRHPVSSSTVLDPYIKWLPISINGKDNMMSSIYKIFFYKLENNRFL